jgi:hypothetical protein
MWSYAIIFVKAFKIYGKFVLVSADKLERYKSVKRMLDQPGPLTRSMRLICHVGPFQHNAAIYYNYNLFARLDSTYTRESALDVVAAINHNFEVKQNFYKDRAKCVCHGQGDSVQLPYEKCVDIYVAQWGTYYPPI